MAEHPDYSNQALDQRIKDILVEPGHEPAYSEGRPRYQIMLDLVELIAEVRDYYKKRKDEAYTERMQCVAALCAHWHNLGFNVGIGVHQPVDDPNWDSEWLNVVFADLPTGQVSWHMHDSHRVLFSHIPLREFTWDGHTTPEKYKRVEQMQSYPIEHLKKAREFMGGDDDGFDMSLEQPDVRLDLLEGQVRGMLNALEALAKVHTKHKDDIDELGEQCKEAHSMVEDQMAQTGPAIGQLESEVQALWEEVKRMGGDE